MTKKSFDDDNPDHAGVVYGFENRYRGKSQHSYPTKLNYPRCLSLGLAVLVMVVSLDIGLSPRVRGQAPDTPRGEVMTAFSFFLLKNKATITITTLPNVPSPLVDGVFEVSQYDRQLHTFPVNPDPGRRPGGGNNRAYIAVPPKPGRLWGFFDVNNNGMIDVFNGVTGPFPRFPSTQGLRPGNSYFGRGQNIVVLALFNSWTTVNRPQFVALHLQTNVKPVKGQQITQANIITANLVAGDLLNSAPGPGGGTMQGVVLSSGERIQVRIQSGSLQQGPLVQGVDVTLHSGVGGELVGLAEGDLFFADSEGGVFGAHVRLEFHVGLHDDRDTYLVNHLGNAVSAPLTIPGP